MAEYYLVIKSLHVIAVISWMAGMLYLPRLYVYHVDAKIGGELDETLKIMERRLLRYIINPAMIVSFILGLALMHFNVDSLKDGSLWLYIKIILLIALFISHAMMARFRKDFEKSVNKRSAKFYRMFNEVPTILMIGIVIFVVLKPF